MSVERVYRGSGAGRWYPSDASDLRRAVTGFIDDAMVPRMTGRVVGGITPHAGYDWSGAVAGHTFRVLRDQAQRGVPSDAVVVLGFSHRGGVKGCAVLDADSVETPLGRAPVEVGLAQRIVEDSPESRFDAAAHADEHSVENAIPFLQIALPDVPIVPILIEQSNAECLQALSRVLTQISQDRNIAVIASTDLLHDADYDRVCASDRATLGHISALDEVGLHEAWAPSHQVCCGIGPVTVLMRVARQCGVKAGHMLTYHNSGDLEPSSRGRWVVGYGALVFALPD